MSSLKVISSELVPASTHDITQSNSLRSELNDLNMDNNHINYIHSDHLNYTFINKEFLPDGFKSPSNYDARSLQSFRNLTSTPTGSSYPLSLPKSLPIDWELFNNQFSLQQKLEQSRNNRYKKRKKLSLQNNSIIEELPFEIMELITNCIGKQNDLIELSQTCTKFNRFVNTKLYENILILNKSNNYNNIKHMNSDFTVLAMENYPKLLATLHSNDFNLQLIKSIIVLPSIDESFQNETNILQPLYDILMTKNNNLQKFYNYDLLNLKKFGSLLKINKDHLIKYNFRKYNSFNLMQDNDYENDSSEIKDIDDFIQLDLLNLQNSVIFQWEDFKLLPDSVQDLNISIENQYTMMNNNNENLNHKILNKLQNLTDLQLSNSFSLNKIINELQPIYNNSNSSFKRLKLNSLSITNIHKNYMNPLISFEKLNSIIDIPYLTKFEIKINCLDNLNCNGACIIEFFNQWFNEITKYDDDLKLNNLESLSIIEINSTSQLNRVNNQWDYLFIESFDKMSKICENLKEFYMNLNDYPKLLTNNTGIDDDIDEIISTRETMYNNLLKLFNPIKLSKLEISDFFYDWLPFQKNTIFINKSTYNLNYFNHCPCSSCDSSKNLIINNLTFGDEDNLNSFQDLILRELFTNSKSSNGFMTRFNPINSMHPLTNSFMAASTNKNNSFLIFKPGLSLTIEEFYSVVENLIHSLINQLSINDLLRNYPNVIEINLGGLSFNIFNDIKGRKFIHSLFNDEKIPY
ncbi:hypothetical protein WICMUC_001250 [Wickerhamomyces mucosus]|uniref:F-box domain-containing protein n=1 Tax=Wickerhamomyces mucosus TaxID=1378264 RepID=A0A9P8THP6_9ASCO|nr:hypothetical protein WICMUC_001250 [Wickerhamomyces mucosus]